MADKWLEREIARGLQVLLAARLAFAPADDINMTLDVWLVAIEDRRQWDETQDAPCIQRAFKTLLQRCETWPTPKQFLDTLPERKPIQALPLPPRTEDERQKAKAALKQIYQTLAKKKAIHNRKDT